MNHQFRENYTPSPDTGISGPFVHTHATTADLVLLWLSGVAVGLVGALLWL